MGILTNSGTPNENQVRTQMVPACSTKLVKRINIATHNINGLNIHKHRVDMLLDWGHEKGFNIIGISETNLQETEARYISRNNTKFRGIWSLASKTKKKGFGVGLLVEEELEKHIGKIERPNEFSLVVHFYFKKYKILVIMLYIPPSDAETAKELESLVQSRINEVQDNVLIVVMGDFNYIVNPILDKSSQIDNNRKLAMHTWLRERGFLDTFRYYNPYEKKFTWSNSTVATRIDQIWVSSNAIDVMQDAEIYNMSTVTGSDHDLTFAKFEWSRAISVNDQTGKAIPNTKQRVWKLEKATKENWDDYRDSLWKNLNNKALCALKQGVLVTDQESLSQLETNLNQMWLIIERAILKAGRNNLPSKVINFGKKPNHKKKKSRFFKAAVLLSKVVRETKTTNEEEELYIRLEQWNKKIRQVNRWADSSIDEIEIPKLSEWQEDAITWWKIIEGKLVENSEKVKKKEIQQYIQKRAEQIVKEQKKMLTSLLERPYSKVVLDRVYIQRQGSTNLLTSPAEVLEEVRSHFQNQFINRREDSAEIEKLWFEEYQPKDRIIENWYDPVTQPITLEEWQLMLNECKTNSAPGMSTITYALLKQANTKTQQVFKNFAEVCLRVGNVPSKWKTTQVYPIPKGQDWEYNLDKIRPIALIEVFRKCVTKILTKRLSKVIKEKEILQGPNFADLLGNSIEEPVHILKALLKEAEENQQEM